MKYIFYFALITQLAACASSSIAQKLSMVSFDEKVNPSETKSIGNIEGKDCTWYVFGYGLGEDPTVRNAFSNAVNQKEMNLVPGQKTAAKGPGLKIVKNVSVENGGFNAYLASRSCVIVTGAGFQ